MAETAGGTKRGTTEFALRAVKAEDDEWGGMGRGDVLDRGCEVATGA
jgi:hypothetical protein